ncbi:hypothetical protein BJV77DRAFT_935229, partial [Russula vinacea]
IAYSLAIFSAAEMKKPKPCCKSKVQLLEVPAMTEWVVFQMQLNVLIANTLYPTVAKIDYSKYEATYTIPNLIPPPLFLMLPLLSSADYMYLLKNATKAKDPAVKIVIVETGPQSQMLCMVFCFFDLLYVGERKPTVSFLRRFQIPKESDILPANIALNDRIKMLRGRWQCNASGCHSDFCFVSADGPHFPLSHEHLEKWGVAWLRSESHGKSDASIDRPPHISLFDPISLQSLAMKSPLLQACLNAMANKAQPAGPQHPFPALQQPNSTSQPLIPAHLQPGIKQDIDAFCLVHGLSNNILERFREHAFTGTQAFRHLNMQELIDLGFKPGEIIDLKEAVSEW